MALATKLVGAGCKPESALWIAIKFCGADMCPSAFLMSDAAEVSQSWLVQQESKDLLTIDWNIAPLARACDIL